LRKKRDEADFQAAKAELEALEAAAEQTGEFQVCYGDEAGFALGKIITSAWQPIGETIEIAATNEDEPQINVFGIYNRQNQFYSTMFEGSLTSEIVIACLDDYSLRITLRRCSRLMAHQFIRARISRRAWKFGKNEDCSFTSCPPTRRSSI
jgi:DDE superfamily endonuclease